MSVLVIDKCPKDVMRFFGLMIIEADGPKLVCAPAGPALLLTAEDASIAWGPCRQVDRREIEYEKFRTKRPPEAV